jgi:hypothetical protein
MTKQEILQDSTEKLTFAKYVDNVQVVPTSATITITGTDVDGDELPTPVTASACTIDALGTISYNMLSANTVSLSENLRAVFSYVVATVTYTDVIYFDIVKKKLTSTVIDQDLLDEFSVLESLTYRVFGKATSASGSNLKLVIDNLRLNAVEDLYKGGEINILSGLSAGFKSTVTAYDRETRTLYLTENLPYALAVGDAFILKKSFKTEIARAFEELKDYVRTQGYRPALVIDDTQLREAHIALAISKVLLPLGEKHRYEYEDYKKRYSEKLSALKLTYDTDESGGTSGDDEPDIHAGQIRLRR